MQRPLAAMCLVLLAVSTPPGLASRAGGHVRAVPGELSLLPDPGDGVRGRVREELGAFLTDLYGRAFRPAGRPHGSGQPVAGLFADGADKHLQDAFEGPGVSEGTLSFSGVATMDGDRASAALLRVSFTGSGSRRRVRQAGELLCVRTEDGLRVVGFQVELREHRAQPAGTGP